MNNPIVPKREFINVPNLGAGDIVDVVSLDPLDGEGIVTDDDITFMANLTNNYRLHWGDSKNIVVQEKATPANKTLYKGTVLTGLRWPRPLLN